MRADKARMDALRTQRIAQNAENLVEQMSQSLDSDDTEYWTEKLNMETLPKEVQLAMALEKFKQSEGLSSHSESATNPTEINKNKSDQEKTLGDETKSSQVNDSKESEIEPDVLKENHRTLGDEER